jgi:phospholipase/carboxylesterase
MEPHGGLPVVAAGAPVEGAPCVLIMAHGRNAAPANILDLLPRIDRPQVAALAPAAAGGTWYPQSFMAPRAQNEPGISSGLAAIEAVVAGLLPRGVPSRRIALLGFSQGACLTSEFVLRHPRRYGGVLALTGGLIGPPGTAWPDPLGRLEGTPVFLGTSDPDPHVPLARVIETHEVFARMGAVVTRQVYPGMGHLVHDDEIGHVRCVLDGILAMGG